MQAQSTNWLVEYCRSACCSWRPCNKPEHGLITNRDCDLPCPTSGCLSQVNVLRSACVFTINLQTSGRDGGPINTEHRLSCLQPTVGVHLKLTRSLQISTSCVFSINLLRSGQDWRTKKSKIGHYLAKKPLTGVGETPVFLDNPRG